MHLAIPCSRAAILPLLLTASLSLPLFGQTKYNIHFRGANYVGAAGQVVSVGIGLDNQPDKVTGFSFGVKHDGAKLALQAVEIGSGLQQALGDAQSPDSDFYVVNMGPASGTGFTVGMILSRDKPTALEPGLDHPLFVVKYKLPDAAEGDTKVEITGELGEPKVAVVLDKNGVSQLPAGAAALTSTTVSVSTGAAAPFIRGDVNQNGKLQVTDALVIFDYLFGGKTLAAGAASRDNCLVVFNVDGQSSAPEIETDINLTDALFLLQYVFQGGPAPPAPFPACGQPAGATSPQMECKSFHCP